MQPHATLSDTNLWLVQQSAIYATQSIIYTVPSPAAACTRYIILVDVLLEPSIIIYNLYSAIRSITCCQNAACTRYILVAVLLEPSSHIIFTAQKDSSLSPLYIFSFCPHNGNLTLHPTLCHNLNVLCCPLRHSSLSSLCS